MHMDIYIFYSHSIYNFIRKKNSVDIFIILLWYLDFRFLYYVTHVRYCLYFFSQMAFIIMIIRVLCFN